MLTDNYLEPGIELPSDEYKVSEIPSGGMATINFRVNGIDLIIHLLAEDMTKFNPSTFDILSLGRPTPYNPDKAHDPRGSDEFREQMIDSLTEEGIVEYHEGNFSFLPRILPPQVYGFEIPYTDGDKVIIKKFENVSLDKIRSADQAVRDVQESIGVLAGKMPGRWLEYYKNIERYSTNGESITLDEVVNSFEERLKRIEPFILSINDPELRKTTLKRIEFLLMNPIATNCRLDKKKIMKIHKVSEDPDKPEKWKKDSGKRPYFGSPYELIADHNAGNIDIFDYYGKLITTFYTIFNNF